MLIKQKARLLNHIKASNRLFATFSQLTNNDPYYTLGVARDDDMKTVKKKYYHLAKQYHPDLNPGEEA